jgi:hypothetical protein
MVKDVMYSSTAPPNPDKAGRNIDVVVISGGTSSKVPEIE